MSILASSVRKLRADPRIHKLPPYLSLLCILGGILWLLLLPLNQYSRQTYISENALLPGQVHTYFTGSEQHVFRGYRDELRLGQAVEGIFASAGLPTASQKYEYRSAGKLYNGTNIYSLIRAPRGDGTEAIVLVAPQKNYNGKDNVNGVALLLTLARYFKRWSLWSKDIILLVTPDTDSGPQAWISAYHSTHSQGVDALPLKSGALQGAVCIDLPLNHRFEKMVISYDGINGQLPNLDLVNTAVAVSSGQMGIPAVIQGMFHHDDSYRARLTTMLRGMSNQALGLGTGAHSVFMPYHIDAITLTAAGDGWQDEMAFGRTVESICRSLNNLLEHFHQSFFFYLLMQTNRFVSIGTYLPSAMAIAAGFTIMAIHLWVKSGQPDGRRNSSKQPEGKTSSLKQPEGEDRDLFPPLVLIGSTSLTFLAPLYLSNIYVAPSATLVSVALFHALPTLLARFISPLPSRSYHLTRALLFLVLGLVLSTLATLNFSLSLALGLLCAPILFATREGWLAMASMLMMFLVSPLSLVLARTYLVGDEWARLLSQAAFGWNVMGSWGAGVGLWVVWFPSWVIIATLAQTSN